MKQIIQSIQNGVSLAYISLLMDTTHLFTSPGSSNIGEIDKDIAMIQSQMKDHISSLDTILGSNEAIRGELALKLQSHHQLLEGKFKIVNAYSRELGHLSTLLENKYHLKTTKPEDIEGINYHHFIHEGLDFLAKAETSQDKVEKTREFLRYLPMRMTKDSFVSYVKESLLKVAPNPLDKESTLFLSVFKQLFDGQFTEGYGQVFSDIFIAIEELKNQSKVDLTTEEIEEIYDDIYLLKETIEELYDIIITLYRVISSFSTLLVLDTLDFDILCHEHISFNDLFYTVKSLITGHAHGEDYTIIVETLPDRLGDIFHEITERYDQSTTLFYETLEKDSFPKTEETLKLIKVFSLIQFYLRSNVDDIFSFSESTDQSSQLPESIILAATAFLADQLNTLKPSERKLRMQYLISMLPFTMDTQAFANYFHGAIEGTSNEIQKAYVLAKLSNFMDSWGYFDTLAPTSDHHGHGHEHCDHH